MKIFLAAGHGGIDPGATSLSVNERDELIKIVSGVVSQLLVVIKPPDEVLHVPDELALEGEVNWINGKAIAGEIAIAVEVHLNANQGSPGSGTETYWGCEKLAKTLQQKAVEVLKLPDRGVKSGDNFYFNRMTGPPSAILELGFINNPSDLQAVRDRGALAIVEGIKAYLQDTGPSTPEQPAPSPDYKGLYEQEKNKVAEIRVLLQKIVLDFK